MNEITYLVVDEANAEAHGLDACSVREVTPVIKPWELNDLNGAIFKITPEALRSSEGAAFAGVLHAVRRDVRHLNDEPVFPNFDGVEYIDPTAGSYALKYVFADQLEGRAVVDEILEGLLTRAAISCMYGDSNCGKTFLAIDITCAIALGILCFGRNVESGLVVYLATEAPGSVEMRVDAYQTHHGVKIPNFCIVQTPINLYVNGADAKLIVDLIRKLEREREQKCILIVGDTLSRIASGANENSGEDMNLVVDRLNHIRAELGAHILLIHHTGKNVALGMRGWSGVRAIIDTEIEVTEDVTTG
jgi:putative DNA primase/helicase